MTNIEIGFAITICVHVGGAIVWAVRKEGDLRVMNEKIQSLQMVTEHLTRAGEGIKEELGQLKGDIRNINTNIEFIKEALEKLSK